MQATTARKYCDKCAGSGEDVAATARKGARVPCKRCRGKGFKVRIIGPRRPVQFKQQEGAAK